jgi:hypothetical protein
MSITESIELLKAYNGPLGLTLHKGASDELIGQVESTYGIILPDDFKTFYRFTDGFETVEDIFNMIPLTEIIENRTRQINKPFYIAEYMIYSDMWQLEISPEDCNDYKIVVHANYNKFVLTSSLAEFIDRFLRGGVFGPDGLHHWAQEVEQQPIYTTKLKTAELLLTVFYYSINYGLIPTKEVVDWADRIIMHENEPEYLFIELSLAHDKNELISLLNPLCVHNSSVIARALLGLLYNRLATDRIGVDNVIAIIDKHDFSSLLTSSETEQIYNLTDEIWMNEPIIDQYTLTQDVLGFLIFYKDFEIENYKYWTSLNAHIEYKISKEEKNSDIQPQQNNYERNLWMIYTVVYLLAFIVLVTTYNKAEGDVPLTKFRNDVYQLSILYFIFFTFYYILKSSQWLVKKIIKTFRKTGSE